VRSLLDLAGLIEAMEKALAAFSRGDVNQPVRTVLDVGPGRGFYGLMPAEITGEDECLGAKLVSVFPGNRAAGLPTHKAVILLHDSRTGNLLAAMDGDYITEMRTAAASAVSVRLLARRGASTAGLLGSGVQAGSHVEALRRLSPSVHIRVWSPTRENARRFAERRRVELAASPVEAVRGADIIILATAAITPIIESAWVSNGAHLVAVGACRPNHREMDPSLLARARLFVDSRTAAMKESGDILLAISEGYFTESHIAGELGEVALKRIPGRTSERELTIFKSLGLAIEDVAAARLAYARALAQGRGIML
jgi:ornithine cyclodeaminase/alanine dehydrogenase-like protein (mu-crystallin family)